MGRYRSAVSSSVHSEDIRRIGRFPVFTTVSVSWQSCPYLVGFSTSMPKSPYWHSTCCIVLQACAFGSAREVSMSVFAWILLGLLAGFIASHLVNHRGEGMVLDVLLGVVGAVIGGWVFHMLGMAGVNTLNLYSLLVAV